MKNSEVDEEKLEAGEYCWKGCSGCFCKVGWPYERLCPDCRDKRTYVRKGKVRVDVSPYCVCDPKDDKC